MELPTARTIREEGEYLCLYHGEWLYLYEGSVYVITDTFDTNGKLTGSAVRLVGKV